MSPLSEKRPPPAPKPTVILTGPGEGKPATVDRLLGQTIDGRFRIRMQLGEGGMGRVYLAEDARLNGRKVALKLMTASLTGDAEFRARFQREALLQANLPHSQICQVLDVGECPEGAYIIMEYSDGRSLSTLLRELGPRPPAKALEMVEQILEVLDFAHRQGVVHRDLKPSNILVEERSGREYLKILDFGIAKLMVRDGDASEGANLTRTGHSFGTLGYMAPEQARGDVASLDHRADLYSVGVLLYELLSGRLPCPPEARTHPVRYAMWVDSTDIPPITRAFPDLRLPADLDRILEKALAREPSARFGSALAFLGAVRSVRRKLEAAESPDESAVRARAEVPGGAARSRLSWVVAAAALAAAAVGWTLYSGARNEVDRLESEVKAAAGRPPDPASVARIEDLEGRLGKAEETADGLRQAESAARSESTAAKATLEQVRKDVARLEKEVQEAEARVGSLDGEKVRLEGEVKSLNDSLAAARAAAGDPKAAATIEKLTKDLADREEKLKTAGELASRAEAWISALKNEIKSLTDGLPAGTDEAAGELSGIRKRLEGLGGEVAAQGAKLSSLQSRNNFLEGENRRLQAIVDAIPPNPGSRPGGPPVVEPKPQPTVPGPIADAVLVLTNTSVFEVRFDEITAVVSGQRVAVANAPATLDASASRDLVLPAGATAVRVKYKKYDPRNRKEILAPDQETGVQTRRVVVTLN